MKKRDTRIFSRTGIIAVLAVFILLPFIGHSGFVWPKDGPPYRYEGYALGPDGTKVDSTINKLMTELNLSEEEACDKLNTMRHNIQQAIVLIKLQNIALGNCLQRALSNGRLCIDFGPNNSNASILPDGTENCERDPINIKYDKVACDTVDIYDPDFYQTFSSLMHEALHAIQDYSFDSLANDDYGNRVRRRLVSSCNEIAAENLENEVIDTLLPILDSIANGMDPTTPDPPAGTIIDAIKEIEENNAREAAARALAERLGTIRGGNQRHLDCQDSLKIAYQRFLEGEIDSMMMNDIIRRQRWWNVLRRSNEAPLNDIMILGGGGSPFIRQISDNQTIEIPTEFATTFDGVLMDGGNKLVVAGNFSEVSAGIIGFKADADGFFNPDNVQFLYNGPIIGFKGVDLSVWQRGTSEELLIFNYQNNNLLRMLDTNEDGFPDAIQDVVSWSGTNLPRIGEIMSVEPQRNGQTAFVLPYVDPLEETTAFTGEFFYQIDDLNNDGIFDFTIPREVADVVAFITTPQSPLVAGATTGLAFAPKLAQIQVVLTDETGEPSFGEVGAGQADEAGLVPIDFFTPLEEGTYIKFFDITNDIYSFPYLVDVGSNVREPGVADHLIIYPQPVIDWATVRFELSHSSNVELVIFDTQGRKVSHQRFGWLLAGEQHLSFHAEPLPEGPYWIVLRTDNGQQTSKMIKVK